MKLTGRTPTALREAAHGSGSTWLGTLRRYALFVGLANLLWESFQVPLYTVWNEGTVAEIVFSVVHCTGGDVLIALASLVAALILLGGADWPAERSGTVTAVAVTLGLAYTVYSEWRNVVVRGSWTYSNLMPVVPPLDTGLSPLLQWLIVPVVGLSWAGHGGRQEPRPGGLIEGLPMADSVWSAWWERLQGRLRPRPCPYSLASALELPGRRLVAGPERVLTAFDVRAGERVLEIGCGTGFYSVEAARRVAASGRLLCLDLQPEMLSHTRRRIETAAQTADLIRGDAQALPLRSASMDRVCLITVLGEIPERMVALREIKRVLRRGGRLSVSEQLPDPDFVTRRTLRRELGAAGFREEQTRGHLFYTSTWSTPT